MELTEYQKQLRDPRWQKKRLLILKRDNFTCRICDSDKHTLDVHHKKYTKVVWDIDDKHLVTLCQNCHRVVTLCQRLKLKPININKLQFLEERYLYLVNVLNDSNVNMLHLFGNLNDIKIVYYGVCVSKDTVELMLKTF